MSHGDASRPRITGAARLAGVMGWPVDHSLSPVLHNYWLERHGIDGAYVPLPTPPDRFETVVRGLQAAGFRGANVTIPHKESAFALCDTVDPMARLSGSVNTLVFGEDGHIHGSSTDGYGFLANLEASDVDLTGLESRGPALLLGAGGAARSIAAALLDRGIETWIANRTEARAQALVESLSSAWATAFGKARPDLKVVPWETWPDRLGEVSLLVNTTSLGMSGGPEADTTPDLAQARSDLIVNDIVYVPLETQLLRVACERGLKTVTGLGMLLHQARPGFQAWFGAQAHVDAATTAYMMAALGL